MSSTLAPLPPSAPKLRAKSKERLERLLRFDRDYQAFWADLPGEASRPLIVGIDEVGRGSLIGPVTAAAIILPSDQAEEMLALSPWFQELNDSKKVTAAKRQPLKNDIELYCHAAIGQASQEEVEQLNVYHASLLAAYRAYEGLLRQDPSLKQQILRVLIDGKVLLPQLPAPHQACVIKGDGYSAAIAAASILAKETRDQWVKEQAEHYPGYEWESNMGYATAGHRKGLVDLGPTPLHRTTFIQKIISSSGG